MIAYAAIDLRGGRVVQLVGGKPGTEHIQWPDPVAVATKWVSAGFTFLHVVDLDAALGLGSNRAQVERIVKAVSVPVQVGGGIRDTETASSFLDAGAARVITGTRALEDPAWLADLAARSPGRVVVAADVEGETILTHGWTQRSAASVTEVFNDLDQLPLAGILVTDVTREGRMVGIDVARFRSLAGATRHPLIAAGGIRDSADLRALASAGIAGAVLGMALYTGGIDTAAVAREFAA